MPGRERAARRAALALVAALLLTASCSDDDGDQSARSTTTDERDVSATAADGETGGERGSIYDTVPEREVEVLDPVGVDAQADFGGGVTARLASIEAVQTEAHLPGEISGPGVAITVEIANAGSQPVDVDNVVVDLIGPDGGSATPIVDPDRPPLDGEVAPGATARGTYVFTISEEDRQDVTLTVSFSALAPTAVFAGSMAT
jgi:hypothetical protein